jgi:CRISPR/Cas system CSM-associated protein Csm3 (group 7 of RAMP superfamily)
MSQVEVALTVRVRTVLAVGDPAAGGGLASRGIARDGWGRPVLPATSVKGRQRHACEQVARRLGLRVCRPPRARDMCPHAPDVPAPCPVCILFGSPGQDAALFWADLHLTSQAPRAAGGATLLADSPPIPAVVRSGIAVSRQRGVAVGSPYHLETTPALESDELTFASERAIEGDLAQPDWLHLLLAGSRLATSIGGGATRGLGWAALTAEANVDGRSLAFDADLLARLAARARS